jgi:SsrA-binding protein
MAGQQDKRDKFEPRISNRRAFHDYHIEAKLECGVALVGTEVKSIRLGRVQLQDAFARVEGGELVLHQCHIDPYDKASQFNHEPMRERKLLVHKREIKRLEGETSVKGVTLVPLSMYFKNGRVKVELGVARGKQMHDKRQAIREKEQAREVRREMSKRV